MKGWMGFVKDSHDDNVAATAEYFIPFSGPPCELVPPCPPGVCNRAARGCIGPQPWPLYDGQPWPVDTRARTAPHGDPR